MISANKKKCLTLKTSDYTLCTQSLHSWSPIHLSNEFGVNTNKKFFACFILCNRLLSNFPASRRSTSMNTEYPRSCKCTLSKLKFEISIIIKFLVRNYCEKSIFLFIFIDILIRIQSLPS